MMPSTRRSNSARISRSSSSGSRPEFMNISREPFSAAARLRPEDGQPGVRGGPDRVADEPERVGALQS